MFISKTYTVDIKTALTIETTSFSIRYDTVKTNVGQVRIRITLIPFLVRQKKCLLVP